VEQQDRADRRAWAERCLKLYSARQMQTVFAVFTATQTPSRLDQAKCFLAREMIRQGSLDLTSEAETYC
jgi:hypothetical protein